MLREGRRQIADFYFAGDIFGLESAEKHSVAAEAITKAKVRIFKRRALAELASSNREVADRLLALTIRELARKQGLVLLLSRSAEERVIGFLIDMIKRQPRRRSAKAGAWATAAYTRCPAIRFADRNACKCKCRQRPRRTQS
jgi:CRP/FNR family transcriptional regulator, nitrogen fixation regulation protein